MSKFSELSVLFVEIFKICVSITFILIELFLLYFLLDKILIRYTFLRIFITLNFFQMMGKIVDMLPLVKCVLLPCVHACSHISCVPMDCSRPGSSVHEIL